MSGLLSLPNDVISAIIDSTEHCGGWLLSCRKLSRLTLQVHSRRAAVYQVARGMMTPHLKIKVRDHETRYQLQAGGAAMCQMVHLLTEDRLCHSAVKGLCVSIVQRLKAHPPYSETHDYPIPETQGLYVTVTWNLMGLTGLDSVCVAKSNFKRCITPHIERTLRAMLGTRVHVNSGYRPALFTRNAILQSPRSLIGPLNPVPHGWERSGLGLFQPGYKMTWGRLWEDAAVRKAEDEPGVHLKDQRSPWFEPRHPGAPDKVSTPEEVEAAQAALQCHRQIYASLRA